MNLNDFSLEELDYVLNCMKRVDGWNTRDKTITHQLNTIELLKNLNT